MEGLALASASCILHLHSDDLVDALSPADCILPDRVLCQLREQVLLPVVNLYVIKEEKRVTYN